MNSKQQFLVPVLALLCWLRYSCAHPELLLQLFQTPFQQPNTLFSPMTQPNPQQGQFSFMGQQPQLQFSNGGDQQLQQQQHQFITQPQNQINSPTNSGNQQLQQIEQNEVYAPQRRNQQRQSYPTAERPPSLAYGVTQHRQDSPQQPQQQQPNQQPHATNSGSSGRFNDASQPSYSSNNQVSSGPMSYAQAYSQQNPQQQQQQFQQENQQQQFTQQQQQQQQQQEFFQRQQQQQQQQFVSMDNFGFAEGTPILYCAYGLPVPQYNNPRKKCIPWHPLCGITFTCIMDV